MTRMAKDVIADCLEEYWPEAIPDTKGAAVVILEWLEKAGFVVVAKSSLVTTDVLAQFNYNEAEASTALAARTALAILQRF